MYQKNNYKSQREGLCRPKNNYTGQRFGAWTMTKILPKNPDEKFITWECVCECGTKSRRAVKKLIEHTQSIKKLNEKIGVELFKTEDMRTDCGCGAANMRRARKMKLYDLIIKYETMKKEVEELYRNDEEVLKKMEKEIEEMKNVFIPT